MNYILPNGVTIQFDNAAEAQAYLNSSAGEGAQTQEAALAANPGQSIQDIASQNAQAWNSPGGQGYADAMAQGHNDPTSAPNAPQPFAPEVISSAGQDPQSYYDQWFQQHLGGSNGVWDWGIDADREAVNQQLFEYLVAQGYSPDIAAFGPDQGGQFQQWLAYQPTATRNAVSSWQNANDPRFTGASSSGAGGQTGGSYTTGQTSLPSNPGNAYIPANYAAAVRNATPAALAAYYQSQGMAGRPYGTTGGEHNFFPNLEYLLPEIIGMPDDEGEGAST